MALKDPTMAAAITFTARDFVAAYTRLAPALLNDWDQVDLKRFYDLEWKHQPPALGQAVVPPILPFETICHEIRTRKLLPEALTRDETATDRAAQVEFCRYCACSFTDRNQHRRSPEHKRNFCLEFYKQRKNVLLASVGGLRMNVLDAAQGGVQDFEVALLENTPTTRKVLLSNRGDNNLVIKRLFNLFPADYLKFPAAIDSTIFPEEGLEVPISVQGLEVGQYRVPILAEFNDGSSLLYQAIEICFKISSPDMGVIEPQTPFVRTKRKNWKEMATFNAIPYKGSSLSTTGNLKTIIPLQPYLLPKSFLSKPEDVEALGSTLEASLDAKTHTNKFVLLLQYEEAQMNVDIRNYDIEGATFTKEGNFLFLNVPGLAEKRPSVLPGDKIFAEDSGKNLFEARVLETEDTRVKLGVSPKLLSKHVPGMRYNIRFTVNRTCLKIMLRALHGMSPDVKAFLFPPRSLAQPTIARQPKAFFNRAIEKNQQQSDAVANIVFGPPIPVPYIIFGPPGTGKTSTVIEAILQVLQNDPAAKVLTAAPSNSAADLIAERLIRSTPESQVLRIYAFSRRVSEVPESIRKISSFVKKLDELKDILKHRVVVSTNVNCGRLVSYGIGRDHFTHLFLDEAGYAIEPEAVISISGLINPAKAKVVLAGDPKQLGPIIRSSVAIKHKLDMSLVERLMETPNSCYQRDDKLGYNPTCITKLVNNYRSHPKLLSLPSQMFYESELMAMADPVMVNAMLNWEHLGRAKFPLIFHSVAGTDKREGRSPSFFNTEEVSIVVDYIQKLLLETKPKVLGSDIGVISPYRQQVSKIKMMLNARFHRLPNLEWKNIKVGSTEVFQGQERKIVIISTVRSKEEYLPMDSKHNLGFLNNPKRFNVATTRSKALMIIVGNPNILSADTCWKQLIDYAVANGGYKGRVVLRSNDEVEDLISRLKGIGLTNEHFGDISEQELQEGPAWEVRD
eukprot:maker-scaffold45_size475391-snap-gene-0.8 protein:Tk10509 transcript:maker-scaffold45_size475391-snap-gene-0.8-mRNA-1 annotation:"hypothetical protein BRAFLDRAFT_119350"